MQLRMALWRLRSFESWDSSLHLRSAPRFTYSSTTLITRPQKTVVMRRCARLSLRSRFHQSLILSEKIISQISHRAREPTRSVGSQWGDGRAFTAGGTQPVVKLFSSHSRQAVTKLASRPLCSCLRAVTLPSFTDSMGRVT